MSVATVLYSDRWGDIIDRPADECVEIRWFDTTAGMSGEVCSWISLLGHVAGTHRRAIRYAADST